MPLEQRTFICETLLKSPGTKATTLRFELKNRFNCTWALSTIRHNRRAMGFRAKVSSPFNRASDPVERAKYRMLWQARGIKPWQCVFMDETVSTQRQRQPFACASILTQRWW